MSYYKTCPECGAHLDPGEMCNCHKAEEIKYINALLEHMTPRQVSMVYLDANRVFCAGKK